MNRLAAMALAGAIALHAADSAAERPVLVLNDTNQAPFTDFRGSGFVDLVAGMAFLRAGLELRLERVPAERGLLLANGGGQDGDLVRIAGLESHYANLVRVPEKLVDWEFAAFSKDASIPGTFRAIRGRSVGLIRGWKIYEEAMAGAGNVVTVEDANQLFRLLELGRIEVALYARCMGTAHLQSRGVKDIAVLQPGLATREMYIYLNKRHVRHAPAIAAALRDLKSEGTYRILYDAKVRPYLGHGS